MQITMYTNKLLNLLDIINLKIKFNFYFYLNKLNFYLRGVNIAESPKFIGITSIKRASGSTISIGSNTIFLSKHVSNLIGINRPCIFSAMNSEARLIIGDGCGFSGTVIGCFSQITLGNNVRCGANTLITDSDWHLDDPRSAEPRPIKIGDNVWLGVNVIVMKGVTIGDNVVIGAGSVVTKDIPANVIAAGNPCRIIKQINL